MHDFFFFFQEFLTTQQSGLSPAIFSWKISSGGSQDAFISWFLLVSLCHRLLFLVILSGSRCPLNISPWTHFFSCYIAFFGHLPFQDFSYQLETHTPSAIALAWTFSTVLVSVPNKRSPTRCPPVWEQQELQSQKVPNWTHHFSFWTHTSIVITCINDTTSLLITYEKIPTSSLAAPFPLLPISIPLLWPIASTSATLLKLQPSPLNPNRACWVITNIIVVIKSCLIQWAFCFSLPIRCDKHNCTKV